MIVFSPHHPHYFLPPGAPKVAIIEDSKWRGWRFLCRLATEAGMEVIVIPRTVSDHFLHKHNVSEQAIAELRESRSHSMQQEHYALLETVRALHLEQVKEKLVSVHAVILPGNEYDVPPTAYGESTLHAKTRLPGWLDFRFDTECLMAHHALARALPVLGICGGMQLLVALTGGKLVQHLPDVLASNDTIHSGNLKEAEELLEWMECNYADCLDDPVNAPCPVNANHRVDIHDDTSHLAQVAYQKFGSLEVCADPTLGVFSIHHQGAFAEHINLDVLKITAKAPDNVIEAVEHRNHPFCVATQFHPEYDTQGLALPLMQELRKHCGK